MTHTYWVRAALAGVVATMPLSLGACAGPGTVPGAGGPVTSQAGGTDGAPPDAAPGKPLAPDCAWDGMDWGNGSHVRLTPMPADAVLTLATRCVYETQIVPGDGEWLVRLTQQATGDFTDLVTALRTLPSETPAPPGTVASCTLDLRLFPVIAVTDTTGRTFYPDVLADSCGHPSGPAVTAIEALHWVTMGTTPVRQLRTELMVTSTCEGQWKPMIALAQPGTPAVMASFLLTPREMRVCRYDLNPADTISIGGPQYAMGVLASAGTLDAAQGGDLLAAVAAAPPAGPCDQPQSPFAIVMPTDGAGPYLAIELAGCHRVLVDGENDLRQLDSTVVGTVLGG